MMNLIRVTLIIVALFAFGCDEATDGQSDGGSGIEGTWAARSWGPLGHLGWENCEGSIGSDCTAWENRQPDNSPLFWIEFEVEDDGTVTGYVWEDLAPCNAPGSFIGTLDGNELRGESREGEQYSTWWIVFDDNDSASGTWDSPEDSDCPENHGGISLGRL